MMLKFFKKIKLSHKLLMLFLLLILQSAGIFLTASYFSNQKEEYAQWHNAAGQLELRAQKVLLNARLRAENNVQGYDRLIRQTESYEQTLHALSEGGVIIYGNEMLAVPAASKEVRSALTVLSNRWETLSGQIQHAENNSADLNRYLDFNEKEFAQAHEQFTAYTGKELEKYRQYTLFFYGLMFLLNIGTLISGFFFVRLQFVVPLSILNEASKRVQKGRFPKKVEYYKKNEIGNIAKAFRMIRKNVMQASEFISNITHGQLDAVLQSASQDNMLTASLLELREKMQQVERENNQRHWTAEGLARFSELLRQHTNGVESLADRLLSELVPYVKANQGAIFLLDDKKDEEEILEMIACYAYDKKKYVDAQIKKGEGLIGQAFQEKSTVYMTDIPDDYIRITSGLGEANPKALLIVPMMINEKVYGMLEMASYSEFEPYQIEFLEKLGESIASSVSMVKANAQTKVLLQDSQQKAEQLHAQEEELRQNMEEMQAQQEEMRRTNLELQGQQNALNNAAIVSESDLKGRITYVNDEFCRISNFSRDELIGAPHNIVRHADMPAEAFKDMWATIGRGNVWKGKVKNRKKDGGFYWVDATITPVMGENGKPMKYIGVRYDITDDVLREERMQVQLEQMQAQEEELRQNMEELHTIQEDVEVINRELSAHQNALNNAAIVSETDKRGTITYVNDAFCEISGYAREELIGQSHSLIRHPEMPAEIFKDLWQTIAQGKIWKGEIKNRKKNGGYYWVNTTITPQLDANGKPYKFLAVRFDITQLKELLEKQPMSLN